MIGNYYRLEGSLYGISVIGISLLGILSNTIKNICAAFILLYLFIHSFIHSLD
jgi:hypothetical protein